MERKTVQQYDPNMSTDSLVKELARDGLMHRKQRLNLRKVRLQQSQYEIGELEKTVKAAEGVIGVPQIRTY